MGPRVDMLEGGDLVLARYFLDGYNRKNAADTSLDLNWKPIPDLISGRNLLDEYNRRNAADTRLNYNWQPIPDAIFFVGSAVWYSPQLHGGRKVFAAFITAGPNLCDETRITVYGDQHVWHTYDIRYLDTTATPPQRLNTIEVPEVALIGRE